MIAKKINQTQIILESEDYSTLDNAVALVQDILDKMDIEGYDYCEMGGEGYTQEDLEKLIGDLQAIYNGDITLK